jgi:hypothetical protein
MCADFVKHHDLDNAAACDDGIGRDGRRISNLHRKASGARRVQSRLPGQLQAAAIRRFRNPREDRLGTGMTQARGAAVGALRGSKHCSERSRDDERAATHDESPECARGQRATASRRSPL